MRERENEILIVMVVHVMYKSVCVCVNDLQYLMTVIKRKRE